MKKDREKNKQEPLTMEFTVMPYQLLEEITDGFSEVRKLGSGAYGKVYKGVQKNGEKIAVKVLYDRPGLDDKQFQNELENLTRLNHKNIIRLVGYCHETRRQLSEYNGKLVLAERTHRVLCLEYMHNGSLRKHLFGEYDGLDWHTRYKIIKGTCEGLKHLHEDLKKPIYHLDLKPDNILLDHNMVPKLADFGLSRLFGEEQTRITESNIGTTRYLPPEYIERNVVSIKLDMFSLGVIIIEIMTGPMGYSRFAEMSSQQFAKLVHDNWRKRLHEQSRLPSLDTYCQQIKRCIEIALKCVEIDRNNRPNIGVVISQLNEIETLIHKMSLCSNQSGTSTGQNTLEHVESRYEIQQVIGKGSHNVVVAAIRALTGERVAIKKITDVFGDASYTRQVLREIKLLRLLRHPDIVECKDIMLPTSHSEFQDIYIVFEKMDWDLHQVIKLTDDLTPEHRKFFMYQLLRALKYIHTAGVCHRDLTPKNILVNSAGKLKICDFGNARVSFNNIPSAIFWTDYVGTRWYRAPELCGSFFSKYSPAADIWSIGCIFAELLTRKPLFPGKNVVDQLYLITDLLGSPSSEIISQIHNEEARRFLSGMAKKHPIPFTMKFPNADPWALRLLGRLLAFNPKDRPTAEEALADSYFQGMANVEREPSSIPISNLEFGFEKRHLTSNYIRELIYREILEYHPQILQEYLKGEEQTNFLYPSLDDCLKRQFTLIEEHDNKGETVSLFQRKYASVPRERVRVSKNGNN